MNKIALGVVAFLGIAVVSVIAVKASGHVKEGRWSVTLVTKINTQNMSPMVSMFMGHGMTITVNQCITHDNPVPSRRNNPQNCQQTHSVFGGTVTFHETCNTNNSQIDSTGTITYSGDTMKGHTDTHQVTRGNSIDSTLDITGQYIGPC